MYKNDSASATMAPPEGLRRVAQAFSTPSWWYDLRGMYLVSVVYRSTLGRQIRFFERHLDSPHLEIPVGNGTVLRFVLRYHRLRRRPQPQVVAIDCSPAMIAAAERKFARWSNVDVRHGDVARLDFPDGHFRSINVANGFHCFPDPEAAVAELFRVSAPGGTVAVNVLLHPRGFRPLRLLAERTNRWAQQNGLLRAPFEADEATALFRSQGFAIDSEQIHGNTLYLLARKPQPTD